MSNRKNAFWGPHAVSHPVFYEKHTSNGDIFRRWNTIKSLFRLDFSHGYRPIFVFELQIHNLNSNKFKLNSTTTLADASKLRVGATRNATPDAYPRAR